MGSSHETAAAALQTLLAGMVSGVDGVVYTPGRVERVSVFDEEALDHSFDSIYLVRPGEERVRFNGNGSCWVESDLEIFILVARGFHDAVAPETVRWQVAADMVWDVLSTVLGGAVPAFTLGGAAVTIEEIRVDYERWVPTWAVAEISLVIRHRHNREGGR